jgi:archaetidylinositol phosphate synthase
MATSLIEFCEQANPEFLRAARNMHQFRNAPRIQQSLTANIEQKVLVWMAERTPGWIGPDHLTILGFAGQMIAGASYALARWNRFWLIAVIAFLALNWLGDSLDGTLARVRQRQRPRYGFYVDHMVDSFGALALMSGLAVSGYMHLYIALGLLTAFLLLSIQSYLATYTLGEFRLSFLCFGPTEMRMLLAIGNVALLFHPMVLGGRYRLFDVGGAIAIVGMTFTLLLATTRTTCRLYREERLR